MSAPKAPADASRLSDLSDESAISVRTAADTRLCELVEQFNQTPHLFGMLLYDGDRFVGPLPRNHTLAMLSRAFHRELYLRKPARQFFHDHCADRSLRLPADLAITDAIGRVIERDSAVRYEPIVVTHLDGRVSLVDVRDLIGRQCRLLAQTLHQAEHQRTEAQHAARHDRLTGLPNRKCMLERLQRNRSTNHELAVLFMDFDHFKKINDGLGHDAGDELLCSISQRMCHTLGTFESHGSDAQSGQASPLNVRLMPARLGGDEFVVIIDPIADADEPRRVAALLVEKMGASHCVKGYHVTSTPSIGVTTSLVSGREPDALIRDADTAMYRAKAEGRNRFIDFEPTMREAKLRKLAIEHALCETLEARGLQLHYQPIVHAIEGSLLGFEALCRWEHPALGRIGPAEFIPVAEDAGLINELGRQCLEIAAGQLADWRARFPHANDLYVSINVSKRQMLAPAMIEHLEAVVAAHKLPRAALCLEVTETLLGESNASITDVLHELRRLGYRLFIDDFGTGVSSLNALHHVPADVIKIDRAFISQLQHDRSYSAVVEAIVNLARNLQMSVICEGIEEVSQLMQVQALDCDAMQGFLFSKPLPAAEAGELLRTGRHFRYLDLVA